MTMSTTTPSSALSTPPSASTPAVARTRRRGALWAIALVSLAPVLGALFAFFVATPQARSNYGDLIEPQRDLPASLDARRLDGRPFDLASWRGKWVMVTVGPSTCDDACATRLFATRQLRASMGEDRGRIELAWLVTDEGTPSQTLRDAYVGTTFVRVDASALAAALPASPGAAMSDHIFIIDPLGHVMLRWPQAFDPKRMRQDLSKLLRASRVG